MKKLWQGKNKWITMGGALGILLFGVYFGFAVYYMSHFYKNTTINGVDCSGMTVSETKEAMENTAKSYALVIEERNGEEQIVGKNVDFAATIGQERIQDRLSEQSGILWLFKGFQKHEWEVTPNKVEYDENKLSDEIDNLLCLTKEKTISPKDAYISGYGDNGFEIIPEEKGTTIRKKELRKQILQSIEDMSDKLVLDQAECYAAPKLTSESENLKKTVDKMNRYGKASITYKFGDKTEVVDGKVIEKWLKVDTEGNVTLKLRNVEVYVNELAKKYNTMGKTRKFKTVAGNTVTVQNGSYGWWLNTPKESKKLKKLVLAGKTVTREPYYFQRAESHTKEDYGNTYVEVNLTTQKVYFIKKGKVIVETACVTGNPSRGNGTPQGTYSLMYKQHPAVLRGDNYASKVNWWMPFNNNIGLHDAPWRHGRFGGSIYRSNGSHGCVNLPPEAAAKIYKYIEPRTAIICYYSSYSPKKKSNEKKKDTKSKSEKKEKKNNDD